MRLNINLHHRLLRWGRRMNLALKFHRALRYPWAKAWAKAERNDYVVS